MDEQSNSGRRQPDVATRREAAAVRAEAQDTMRLRKHVAVDFPQSGGIQSFLLPSEPRVEPVHPASISKLIGIAAGSARVYVKRLDHAIAAVGPNPTHSAARGLAIAVRNTQRSLEVLRLQLVRETATDSLTRDAAKRDLDGLLYGAAMYSGPINEGLGEAKVAELRQSRALFGLDDE